MNIFFPTQTVTVGHDFSMSAPAKPYGLAHAIPEDMTEWLEANMAGRYTLAKAKAGIVDGDWTITVDLMTVEIPDDRDALFFKMQWQDSIRS